jgi:hypothetical protein
MYLRTCKIWVFLLLVIPAQAQRNPTEIINQLNSFNIPDGALYSFQLAPSSPLYWPELEQLRIPQEAQVMNFISWRGKIYLNPSGTGQILLWVGTNNESVSRIDSSNLIGYNYGAIHFVQNDTLYSLGGYGYWQHNHHLRFLSGEGAEWNLQRLNKNVPVGVAGSFGIWHDRQSASVHYLQGDLNDLGNYEPNHLRNQPGVPVIGWKLDLKHRTWSRTGILNEHWRKMYTEGKKVGFSNNGEILLFRDNEAYHLYEIDYRSNAVRLFNWTGVNEVLASPKGDLNKFSWVDKQGFHVGPFRGKYLNFAIEKSEYLLLEEPLLVRDNESTLDWLWKAVIALCLIGIGFGAGRWWIYRVTGLKRSHGLDSLFNPFELSLVMAMWENPEKAITSEEMNVILKTDKRSLEVQKRYRSEAVKGVNEKCSKYLNTEESLILQRRLESDRRQFEYLINHQLMILLEAKLGVVQL